MVIQHNIPAINAHRNLGINNSKTAKNLEKLSSGYKINRAGDDAAGLAISEKMRGQIRGLGMAEQNANNGISLIQTAEGGLNETHAILQRMRELAVQSSNGTYQDSDRALIEKEYQALKSEIDRIASYTNYNGIKLLDGTTGGVMLEKASLANPADAAILQDYSDAFKALNADFDKFNAWLDSKAVLSTADVITAASDITSGSGYAVQFGKNLSLPLTLDGITGAVKDGALGTHDTFAQDAMNYLGFVTADEAAFEALTGPTLTNKTGEAIVAATNQFTFTYDKNTDSYNVSVTALVGTAGTAVAVDFAGVLKAGESTVRMYVDGDHNGEKYIELDFGVKFTGIKETMVDIDYMGGAASDKNTSFTFDFKIGAGGIANNAVEAAGSNLASTALNIVAGLTKAPVSASTEVDLTFTWTADPGSRTGGGWTVAAKAGSGFDLGRFTGSYFDTAENKVYLFDPDMLKGEAFDKTKHTDNSIIIEVGADNNVFINADFETLTTAAPGRGMAETVTFTFEGLEIGENAPWTGAGAKTGTFGAIEVWRKDPPPANYATDGFAAAALDGVITGAEEKTLRDTVNAILDGLSKPAASTDPSALRADRMLTAMGLRSDSVFSVAEAYQEALNGKDAYIVTRESAEKMDAYPPVQAYETLLQIGDKAYRGVVGEDGISMVFKDGDKTVATLSNAFAAKESGAIRFNIGDSKLDGALAGKENAIIGANGNAELVFQIGANGAEDQQVGMYVFNMSSHNLGNHEKGRFVSESTIANRDEANIAVNTLDSAINYVSGQRAELGALQNRLEHTLNNLGVTKENLTAAESSIRDVDMAKEMMEFTKNNILVQAAQAMLAQANQLPQGVLQLLR